MESKTAGGTEDEHLPTTNSPIVPPIVSVPEGGDDDKRTRRKSELQSEEGTPTSLLGRHRRKLLKLPKLDMKHNDIVQAQATLSSELSSHLLSTESTIIAQACMAHLTASRFPDPLAVFITLSPFVSSTIASDIVTSVWHVLCAASTTHLEKTAVPTNDDKPYPRDISGSPKDDFVHDRRRRNRRDSHQDDDDDSIINDDHRRSRRKRHRRHGAVDEDDFDDDESYERRRRKRRRHHRHHTRHRSYSRSSSRSHSPRHSPSEERERERRKNARRSRHRDRDRDHDRDRNRRKDREHDRDRDRERERDFDGGLGTGRRHDREHERTRERNRLYSDDDVKKVGGDKCVRDLEEGSKPRPDLDRGRTIKEVELSQRGPHKRDNNVDKVLDNKGAHRESYEEGSKQKHPRSHHRHERDRSHPYYHGRDRDLLVATANSMTSGSDGNGRRRHRDRERSRSRERERFCEEGRKTDRDPGRYHHDESEHPNPDFEYERGTFAGRSRKYLYSPEYHPSVSKHDPNCGPNRHYDRREKAEYGYRDSGRPEHLDQRGHCPGGDNRSDGKDLGVKRKDERKREKSSLHTVDQGKDVLQWGKGQVRSEVNNFLEHDSLPALNEKKKPNDGGYTGRRLVQDRGLVPVDLDHRSLRDKGSHTGRDSNEGRQGVSKHSEGDIASTWLSRGSEDVHVEQEAVPGSTAIAPTEKLSLDCSKESHDFDMPDQRKSELTVKEVSDARNECSGDPQANLSGKIAEARRKRFSEYSLNVNTTPKGEKAEIASTPDNALKQSNSSSKLEILRLRVVESMKKRSSSVENADAENGLTAPSRHK